MRCLVLAMVLALGWPAVVVASPTLRLRDLGPVTSLVRADGERFIATAGMGTGDASVFDTATGARRSESAPAGCAFRDIHRATVLWTCSSKEGLVTGKTLELLSGTVGVLPSPVTTGAEQVLYEALGDHWARARRYGYHYDAALYVNRRTGRQAEHDYRRRDQVFDPDHPALRRKLCSGQRMPLVVDESFPLAPKVGEKLASTGRLAAATTTNATGTAAFRVQLQRCGGSTTTLRVCRRVACSQPVLTRTYVAWTEGDGKRSTLVVRSLRTGTTRRAPFVGATAAPLLVSSRLYVAGADSLLRAAL